jgi:uncharacterized protein YukE
MDELENKSGIEKDIKDRESLGSYSSETQPGWKQETEKMQHYINVMMKTIEFYGKAYDELNRKVNSLKEQIKTIKKEVNIVKDSLRKTELKSIEVIGIISAIIALVLAFIDTSNKIVNTKDAYIILTTGTASLVLFSVLLHYFFNKEDRRSWTYYLFFIGLPLLVIFALGFYVLLFN